MIGNVAGYFHLPLGIATNFLINRIKYLVPTAVEESSVLIAAFHIAKLAREAGEFHARADEPVMRARTQVMGVSDLESANAIILEHKLEWKKSGKREYRTLCALGDECEKIEVIALQKWLQARC